MGVLVVGVLVVGVLVVGVLAVGVLVVGVLVVGVLVVGMDLTVLLVLRVLGRGLSSKNRFSHYSEQGSPLAIAILCTRHSSCPTQ